MMKGGQFAQAAKVLMDGVTGAERKFWILFAVVVLLLAPVGNVRAATTPIAGIPASLAAI